MDYPTDAQLARQAEFEPVMAEYNTPLQLAGLPAPSLGNADTYTSADQYRANLLWQLQQTLPAKIRMAAPSSVLLDYKQMFPAKFRELEQAVQAKVIEAAHASPTLRPVVTCDRTGREITEYFGNPRSWQEPFRAKPRQMLMLGEVPFGD